MRKDRTLKMMEDFMPLHNAGHSIPEIAKMTGVDFSVIYRHLGEIATKNGVARESLLEAPHPNYSKRGKSKMAIYRLKGKTMHELVKHGFTKADFCAKYQCTEEELIAQIRKILCDDSRAVNEILNEITVNEKRAAKSKSKPSEEPATTAIPDTQPDTQPTPAISEDANLEKQREQRLAELNAEKEELFQKSEAAIKKYAEADKSYGRYSNRLKELDCQVKELKATLVSCEAQREEALMLCNQFLEQRTAAMEEREATAYAIASISLKIADLSAVQLIACENGHIEALDEPDFVMDETDSDKYYSELFHDLRCSEFRMKDISLLARAMAIRKNTKDRRIVVTFDDERLTHFFAEVVA